MICPKCGAGQRAVQNADIVTRFSFPQALVEITTMRHVALSPNAAKVEAPSIVPRVTTRPAFMRRRIGREQAVQSRAEAHDAARLHLTQL